MTLTPERAILDDAPAIHALRAEAREWLSARGSDQWDRVRDSDPESPRSLEGSIRRGDVYVVRDGSAIVATITVDTYADPEFWTPEDEPDSALYVHRMIVARSAAGANLGGRLIDWAAQLATERGKRWLRLDAWRSNLDLHAYYARHGFEHVRTVHLPHRGSGALFQRPAQSSGSAG